MRTALFFSLGVLGVTSVISQVILLRELINSFYGNELFVGLVLSSWLLWVAAGSYMLANLFAKGKDSLRIVLFCHLFVPLLLPVEISLIRFLRGLTPVIGTIPNLLHSFVVAVLVPAPICLLLGLQFVAQSRALSSASDGITPSSAVSKAYLLENIGFVIGGIAFSYYLVLLNQFIGASVLAFLNLLSLFLLSTLEGRKRPILKFAASLSLLGFLILSLVAGSLDRAISGLGFRGQKLLESQNSPYGNIAVTKIGNQHNFYESGLLFGSDKETRFNEYLIHLSLLQHKNPANVLLIGGGFNGAINEILKHPVRKVYYLELDSKIVDAALRYIPTDLRQALHDRRVKILNSDGRYFLKMTRERFDVVIINLPDPSTALLNRFYTEECFREIKSRLKDSGLLATYLSFSPDYLSRELENLNVSLYKTLKAVFSQVLILPDETNFFLASPDITLTLRPEELLERFKERGLKTSFLTENYIRYRLRPDRILRTRGIFEGNEEAKINRDFHPVSYYYSILFWLTYFHPGIARFMVYLGRTSLPGLLGGTVLAGLMIGLLLRRGRREDYGKFLPVAIGSAGLSLMASELILIFVYQAVSGYLYYRIALLIAALMLGLSLGTWWGTTRINRRKITVLSLVRIHILLMFYYLLLVAILPLLAYSQRTPILAENEVIFFLMAIFSGLIVGIEFPYVTEIYLQSRSGDAGKGGSVYSADLVGACLGAVLPSLFFIPMFGIRSTLIFLAVVNFSTAIFLGCVPDMKRMKGFHQ